MCKRDLLPTINEALMRHRKLILILSASRSEIQHNTLDESDVNVNSEQSTGFGEKRKGCVIRTYLEKKVLITCVFLLWRILY